MRSAADLYCSAAPDRDHGDDRSLRDGTATRLRPSWEDRRFWQRLLEWSNGREKGGNVRWTSDR